MPRKAIIIFVAVIVISIAVSFKLQPAAKDKLGLIVRKPVDTIYSLAKKPPAENPGNPQSTQTGYFDYLKQRFAETGSRLEANRPRNAQQVLKQCDGLWKATDDFADKTTDKGKEIRDLIIIKK